jgi:hypothetical protein
VAGGDHGCAGHGNRSSAAATGADTAGWPTVRFATFNASLNRGAVVADMSTPGNAPAQTIADIVQRARTDVLLINEVDFVEGGCGTAVPENYLSVGQ